MIWVCEYFRIKVAQLSHILISVTYACLNCNPWYSQLEKSVKFQQRERISLNYTVMCTCCNSNLVSNMSENVYLALCSIWMFEFQYFEILHKYIDMYFVDGYISQNFH